MYSAKMVAVSLNYLWTKQWMKQISGTEHFFADQTYQVPLSYWWQVQIVVRE